MIVCLSRYVILFGQIHIAIVKDKRIAYDLVNCPLAFQSEPEVVAFFFLLKKYLPGLELGLQHRSGFAQVGAVGLEAQRGLFGGKGRPCRPATAVDFGQPPTLKQAVRMPGVLVIMFVMMLMAVGTLGRFLGCGAGSQQDPKQRQRVFHLFIVLYRAKLSA